MDIYADCTCSCCKQAKTSVVANNPTELLFNLNVEGWILMNGCAYCKECSAELMEMEQ